MSNKASKRLTSYFMKATAEEGYQGLMWYSTAHQFAKELAKQYKLPLETVTSVISVLSPAVVWDINKRDAKALIKAYYSRGFLGATATTVSTYNQNKRKAISILLNKSELELTKTNNKTYNFHKNILKPTCLKHVTIDRHALKAFKGIKKGGSVFVSPSEYKRVGDAYRRTAEHLGLLPCQLQAIVWLAYKESVGR